MGLPRRVVRVGLAVGERVLSCMGESSDFSDIERLQGEAEPVSSSRSRWSSSSHPSKSSSLSESSPIWHIRERRYSGSEGSVLALLTAIMHRSLGISQAA